MSPTSTVNKVKNQAVAKTRATVNTPAVEALARFGYIARGVIYALIGLLSAQLAFSSGGQVTNQTGALQYIGAQSFGKILLLALTIGLFGYAMWGVIRALLDPLGRGSDAKGLVERVGFFFSGISYSLLALLALYYATGIGKGAGNSQDFTTQLLAQPFGKWLVVLLGIVWLGAGAGQLYVAYKADFKKDLRPNLSPSEKLWSQRLGQLGFASRGVVFALIGLLTLRGGLGIDPKKTIGFDDALQQLAHQPFGMLLLGVVALGLLAFGIYSMLCARWMTILPGHQK